MRSLLSKITLNRVIFICHESTQSDFYLYGVFLIFFTYNSFVWKRRTLMPVTLVAVSVAT